jgi:hypothetical protein
MRQAAKVSRVPRGRRVAVLGNGADAPPVVTVRELSDAERAAEAEAAEPQTLLDRLAPRHAQMIENYIRYSQGMYDEEDGHKLTDREISERASSDAQTFTLLRAEQARKAPAQVVTWEEIGALAEVDNAAALAKWGEVKQTARDELTSGFRSADIAGENISPFDRARFIALLDQLEDGWQPRNGVECSLVEMLAQTLSLYQYWTQIAHARAVGCAEETREEGRKTGYWPRLLQDTADAIEQAQRLADGYHRQYMRTLRQMRDLRRYTPPVIVNNGGQVNVATDSGQQINVTK